MDPLSSLNYTTDTTIAIMKHALSRGIDVWISQPEKLIYRDGKMTIRCQKIVDNSLSVAKSEEISLEDFNIFFIRQDPPFDMNYISNCYLLEIHKQKHKNPIFINDPSGIKNFTEKIFPLYFHKLMPYTIISSCVDVFNEALNKHESLIVKPLYNKGGEGIIKIDLQDVEASIKFTKIVKKYKSPVVIQEFLENVKLGDKRVILIDGDPVGIVNRVPKRGDFKANLHLGGEAKKTSLTNKEREICILLKKELMKNKLFMVGIDLISEKLTEINVTSPTGITQIDELYGFNLSEKILDRILKKI